jgi:hypothetical protein
MKGLNEHYRIWFMGITRYCPDHSFFPICKTWGLESQQALPQPQVTSFCPLAAAHIIADAHPTPLSTLMAFVGQLS